MKKVLLYLIIFYQKRIYPVYITFSFLGSGCRFRPTCSEYTYQAVERYGTIKGLLMGIKRILKCNPFFKGGYDPLTVK